MDVETLKSNTDSICKEVFEMLAYCERHPRINQELQLWITIYRQLEKITGGKNVQEEK